MSLSDNLKTYWTHNLHNFFQNQDSYTPFLEQPFEEKSEQEKSIEILHETSQQFQNSFAQSIYRLETQLSQLVNIHRNEKTHSYQPLTNSDISNSIDLTRNHVILEPRFNFSTPI